MGIAVLPLKRDCALAPPTATSWSAGGSLADVGFCAAGAVAGAADAGSWMPPANQLVELHLRRKARERNNESLQAAPHRQAQAGRQKRTATVTRPTDCSVKRYFEGGRGSEVRGAPGRARLQHLRHTLLRPPPHKDSEKSSRTNEKHSTALGTGQWHCASVKMLTWLLHAMSGQASSDPRQTLIAACEG